MHAFWALLLGHRRTRGVPSVLALPLVIAVGCGGGQAATSGAVEAHTVAHETAGLAVSAQLDALPEGVVAETTNCNGGNSDACDGRDDDCDGRIDEGCGWESGPVQITLAWDSGADLDLYVTDPTGFTISYLDRTSPSGGVLDHDARGACIPGGEAIENVHWTSATPPSGNYRVDVHYWGACGVAGTTRARVTVSVGGHTIGTYGIVLEMGQRRATLAFAI